MGDSFFYMIIGIAVIGLVAVVIGYFVLSKTMNKEDIKYARELKKGSEGNKFSLDILYQKLYVF